YHRYCRSLVHPDPSRATGRRPPDEVILPLLLRYPSGATGIPRRTPSLLRLLFQLLQELLEVRPFAQGNKVRVGPHGSSNLRVVEQPGRTDAQERLESGDSVTLRHLGFLLLSERLVLQSGAVGEAVQGGDGVQVGRRDR